MKSEVGVRISESGSFESANLIVHPGIMDIFHQTINPPGILGVIQEAHKVILV